MTLVFKFEKNYIPKTHKFVSNNLQFEEKISKKTITAVI